MQQHFVGVLILLILIMLLNLESGLGRILYLGVIVLCLGLVFGTILLMIITFAFILYAAVKSIQEQHHLHH